MKSSGIGSGRRKKGFTLMELLIVVAIIAILVAISIPVFAGQLERAKEATCLANRRSLKSLVTESWMSGGQAAVDSACKENQGLFNCPDGGTIDYYIDSETGVCTVVCSYHDKQDATKKMTSDFLNDVKFSNSKIVGKLNKNSRVDSTANNQHNKNLTALSDAMKKAGITLTDSGAQSWALVNNASSQGKTDFIWSTYEISSGAYRKVPAIDYNYASKNYYVSLATVDNPLNYHSDLSFNYYVLQPDAVNSTNGSQKSVLENSKSFTTYAQALAYYNSLSPVKK